jgi:hypothetical protein
MKKMYVFVILVITGFSAGAQQAQLPVIEITADSRPGWLHDLSSHYSEDKLLGIGVGELSTENASCEQAKFMAQAEICGQISHYIREVRTELSNPSSSEQGLVDKLNLYQNECYKLLSSMALDQVAFELSEFITVEQRTKTKDGNIWYLVSIQKDTADNFVKKIVDYQIRFVESYAKDLDNYLANEGMKRKDEAFKKMGLDLTVPKLLNKTVEEIHKSVEDASKDALDRMNEALKPFKSGELEETVKENP